MFRAASDFLLRHREDYDTAHRDFEWPQPAEFNWALDWFDTIGERRDGIALCIVDANGSEHASAPRRRSGGCSSKPISPRWTRRRPKWSVPVEPLNPEIIEQVRRVWLVTTRDGFGQTETSV